MKYFKLGLLAVTMSLVALVIALDKKNSKESKEGFCGCRDENLENEFSEGIVVEESII